MAFKPLWGSHDPELLELTFQANPEFYAEKYIMPRND